MDILLFRVGIFCIELSITLLNFKFVCVLLYLEKLLRIIILC
jgi:hypothetical protein